MIVRLVAIDTSLGHEGELVNYQVPEKSRSLELLCEMLDAKNIPWEIVHFKRRGKGERHDSQAG